MIPSFVHWSPDKWISQQTINFNHASQSVFRQLILGTTHSHFCRLILLWMSEQSLLTFSMSHCVLFLTLKHSPLTFVCHSGFGFVLEWLSLTFWWVIPVLCLHQCDHFACDKLCLIQWVILTFLLTFLTSHSGLEFAPGWPFLFLKTVLTFWWVIVVLNSHQSDCFCFQKLCWCFQWVNLVLHSHQCDHFCFWKMCLSFLFNVFVFNKGTNFSLFWGCQFQHSYYQTLLSKTCFFKFLGQRYPAKQIYSNIRALVNINEYYGLFTGRQFERQHKAKVVMLENSPKMKVTRNEIDSL